MGNLLCVDNEGSGDLPVTFPLFKEVIIYDDAAIFGKSQISDISPYLTTWKLQQV